MSTTSEALVQLAEQKEALRQICNRYLDSEDRLAVDCTLQDIIDVLDEYDEYSYMNAFLNSIEVFPDKDYSINDTEGHITRLRPYAFYNNTALKSINLPGLIALSTRTFYGCNNLNKLIVGATTLSGSGIFTLATGDYVFTNATDISGNIFAENQFGASASLLTSLNFPKYSGVLPNNLFYGLHSLKNVQLPKYTDIGRVSLFNDTPSLQTVVLGGTGQTIGNSAIGSILNAPSFILTHSNFVTLAGTTVTNSMLNILFYVPASLLSEYQEGTNWATIHAQTPIQAIEPNINDLRELGADFSYTPYANKKWDGTLNPPALVTDSSIGEEVDE